MPWEEVTVDAQRQQVCYRIEVLKQRVTDVGREAGVSRKTIYKWLARYREDPAAPLVDRSRRPKCSPGRTAASVESTVLSLRDEHGWGGRKIQRLLLDGGDDASIASVVPSIRTVSAILKRCGRTESPTPTEQPASQRFERSSPNELWQFDHLGPREIERQRRFGFTAVDDHSRFCFCFEPLADLTINAYWPVLWRAFDEFGLPESILCDNAFGLRGLGMSELEMRLIRLGIKPIHGRPYHPQTQGKIERLHGTIERELFRFKARCDQMKLFLEDRDRWLRTYNYLRPHESLGDRPPISRWQMSPRTRPQAIPPMSYDAGQILRKVSQVGDIHYQGARIGVAGCLSGQYVRIDEREHDIGVFYGWKELRTIPLPKLKTRHRNERI
jgi:transposase InsO family protein